jgi:hypothetical protein
MMLMTAITTNMATEAGTEAGTRAAMEIWARARPVPLLANQPLPQSRKVGTEQGEPGQAQAVAGGGATAARLMQMVGAGVASRTAATRGHR